MATQPWPASSSYRHARAAGAHSHCGRSMSAGTVCHLAYIVDTTRKWCDAPSAAPAGAAPSAGAAFGTGTTASTLTSHQPSS